MQNVLRVALPCVVGGVIHSHHPFALPHIFVQGFEIIQVTTAVRTDNVEVKFNPE